jgi:hypothetical protein
VEVALVRYNAGQDDPVDVTDLVSTEQITGADQVFWYVSTGKRNEDMFFVHGGFFAPVKTSAVAIRRQGRTINIYINAPPGVSASILESTDMMRTWNPVSAFTVTSPVMEFSFPLNESGVVFYKAVLSP